MRKKFNTTGLCLPQKHYMADISGQLCQIAAYVKEGSYCLYNGVKTLAFRRNL